MDCAAGEAHACCGHTDSSLKVVWVSGSCLALGFSAGAMLVTPKCCPLSQGCLQGSSLGPTKVTAATAAMCCNPRMGHAHVLMDSVESAPPDFLLCCKILENWGCLELEISSVSSILGVCALNDKQPSLPCSRFSRDSNRMQYLQWSGGI